MKPLQNFIYQNQDNFVLIPVKLTQKDVQILENWSKKLNVSFAELVGFMVSCSITDTIDLDMLQ